MNTPNKWLAIAGYVLHALLAAMLIMAGGIKLIGPPPEMIAQMNQMGIGDKLQLIGFGEVMTAILILIPRTAPLGTLLMSGFWGGVICTHMLKQESMVPWSIMLAVTWIAAEMRGCIHLFWRASDASPATKE